MAEEFMNEIPGSSVESRSFYIRRIMRAVMNANDSNYLKSPQRIVREVLTSPTHRETRIRIMHLVEQCKCTAVQVLADTEDLITWPVCSAKTKEGRMQRIISKLVKESVRKKIAAARHVQVLQQHRNESRKGREQYLASLGIAIFTKEQDAMLLDWARKQKKRKHFKRHDHQEIADAINATLGTTVTADKCRRRLSKIRHGNEAATRRRERKKQPPVPEINGKHLLQFETLSEEQKVAAVRSALGIA
jgi:hypothetical protein